MPQPILDRDDQAYHEFLNFAKCLLHCRGIITNTFRALESSAIKAITGGACVPDGSTPPLYCIGPLIVDAKDRALSASEECISWLNGQPRGSVVFLCFGSRGAFSDEQLKEIAIGLERSDQRFLWVVRNPPPNTNTDPDLEVLLPQGFLERTRNRGLVVKSWAPQGDVLRHDSVGGFVTHCGWNSLVEAVSAGVPMVAWPLYAEQHLNSVVLVEEMKLAIPMIDHTSSSLPGLVIADVVGKRVRELMVERKSVRDRSVEMKGTAVAAWTDGGSSLTDFSEMVASWK